MIINDSTHAIDKKTEALQDTLLRLFKVLNDSHVEYALLHPGDGAFPDVSSDIDIILTTDPENSIVPAISKLCDETGAVWSQSLHYDVPHGYYYVLQVPFDNGYAYLQLDCLYDPIGINRYHLNSEQLLRDKEFDNGYYRVANESEALYLIIKRSLKGNADKNNIAELTKYISQHSNTLRALLNTWLGLSLSDKTINLCAAGKTSKFADLLNSSSATIEKHFAFSHPVNYFIRRVTTTIRQLKRFFRPTGLFIVLIGPDGCGKSTISDNLRNNMERCFRNTWRFHWRPKLLPKLGRNATDHTSQPGDIQSPAPPKDSKYNTLISLIRFMYYLLDFVIGYWLIIYPKKSRTTFIIGERYFADILVHPARYGFALPALFMRLCAYLVPKPDVIILLHGDPQKIHDRKPELPVETIATQIDEYLSEITHWGEHIVINTTDLTPEQAVHSIENQLGELLSTRNSTPHTPVKVKRVFPPFGRPRILIDENILKSHIENLYSPDGLYGKALTSLMYNSPVIIRRMLTRSNNSSYFGSFPSSHADKVIKKHLSLPDATVSYYLGNGGPRSKITAQVVSSGRIVAYVKIANTEEATKLVNNENEVLNSLHGNTPINMPENIGFISSDEWQYLFQTCPDNYHSLNNFQITNEVESLAHSIFNSELQESSLDQYLKSSLLEERINSIADFNEISSSKYTCVMTLRNIKKHFSNKPLIIGRSHGDFSAWNIIEDDNGELFIFDWEYSDSLSPALADLIHFIRVRYHFIEHCVPEKLAELIFQESTNQDSLLKTHALRYNIAIEDIPHYAALYLIRELLRHAETGNGSEKTLKKCNNQIEQINYLSRCLNALCEAIKHGKPLQRVLVSAYACEADQGSEPGVGWNWVKIIGKYNHTWVITKKNNKDSIESYLSSNPNQNLNFIYVDVPKWLSFWKKGQRGVRTYYYLWQFSALMQAKKLHKKIDFDLGHHVTFVNDWLWSFFALMPIPYIWGPIGSHPKVPSGLLPHRRAWLKEFLRLTIQRSMRSLDPLYWITAIRAKRIICINNETSSQFPLTLLNKDKFIVESAIAHEGTLDANTNKPDDITKILYVGRFHHTKCPDLAIEAFSKSLDTLTNTKLVMVGRGPEETYIKKMAEDLGCADSIEFIPWCSQAEVFDLMSSSSLFLFPSTEGGGMVVIEAMAQGLPVVCLNYGGPGIMVPDNCGFKSPLGSRQNIVENLSDAIIDYCLNRNKLNAASDSAREHALTNMSWLGKSERILKIYNSLLEPEIS